MDKENQAKTLKMMRKIKCVLKSGAVIEYYQLDDTEDIHALMNYEDDDMIYLNYVNNPNHYYSSAAIPKENIDYFLDTDQLVIQLPDDDWTASKGELHDWTYSLNNNQNSSD